MKLREQKHMLFFLQALEKEWEKRENPLISDELIQYLTRDELEDIIIWLYPKIQKAEILTSKKDTELLNLINENINILRWVIHLVEHSLTQLPKFEQKEISEFFKRTENKIHYLASKPVENWDTYDKSNYYALLAKTGTTKRVYAIFTSDVKEEDKYIVTTQPSYFFDTKEEAEEEMERCYEQGLNKWDSLKVMSLWKIS